PQLPVLILTMFPEDQLALRLLEMGAAGYLTKESAPEELLRALERVMAGHKYLSPAMAQAVADGLGGPPPAPHEQLSERELEVLRLLAAGRPITAISKQLGLSPKTVTTYRARLLHKLRMRSNAELTLPGFGGGAALGIARRTLPAVPIILVTGSLNEEPAVDYLKAGATDYILKARIIRLGPAVMEALERARQRQELRRQDRLLR